MSTPASSRFLDKGAAERTYLAEERTFGAWHWTAMTMLVTALAIEQYVYGHEPAIEAFGSACCSSPPRAASVPCHDRCRSCCFSTRVLVLRD